MISQFAIARPRSAIVLAIVITIAGLLSLRTLPVNMYPPELVPPQIQVVAIFPGANAQTIEEAVIRPLEEQINGVEHMIYIESTASNDGSANIKITFASGVDTDQALVNVQNRVAIAEPSLPEEVRRQGISTLKSSSSMLLGITLVTSQPDNFDELFLSNYANNNIVESLSRLKGVADVQVMGEKRYSMRVWLNPDKLASRKLTIEDVRRALQEQNAIVAAGKLGEGPTLPDQQFEYSIQTKGRLSTPNEFSDTIIKANPDGSTVHLRDIARVELGSQNYSSSAKLNNSPTSFIVVYQLPDANAIEVAEAVRERIGQLSHSFPDGIEYSLLFDTTRFIDQSISELVKTLFQAVGLVILVVFIFLQNWRTTLIPAIAIPVSLVATFAVMQVLGYTINTITLFGLVLAIGVVVDDAIVVVENVERLMKEKSLSAREATSEAMQQVSGPIIATTLVLLAVFVPVGFLGGITGEIYRQFSVTISAAVAFSSLNALTLSPALCASFLRADSLDKTPSLLKPIQRFLSALTKSYSEKVVVLLRHIPRMMIMMAGLLVFTLWAQGTTPTGFIPEEDQGYIFLNIQLPDAASSNRTDLVVEKVSGIVLEDPEVTDIVTVSGYSLLAGAGSNYALGIVVLKPWDERPNKLQHVNSVIQRLQGRLWALQDAEVIAFNLPAVSGLGNSSGFDLRLQDTLSRSPQEFSQVLNGLIYSANQTPELEQVFSTFRANVPQYYLEVDRDKAKALGVNLNEIFLTLQAQLGSLYINDFNLFGRNYQVVLQAEAIYRHDPSDLIHFFVRSSNGTMVPLSTLARMTAVQGPISLSHYNLYRSATISGKPAPGESSGDAIQAMQDLANQLPEGFTYEWSGQSLQELQSGQQVLIIFALALLFVYLFLVAQYESWTIPLSVIASIPLALAGAYGTLRLTGAINNVYAQIAVVLLIGLSTKTAILMVEFAMQERAAGKSIQKAAANAARLRFRAVLMTALSFVLGVLPLVFASGAGAESRYSMGITVFSGMMSATVLTPLMMPLFYNIVQQMRESFRTGSPAISSSTE